MDDNKKCLKCGSKKFWAVDNKTEYVEICSDCKAARTYHKQHLLDGFECEYCGNDSGEFLDRDDKVSILCSNCEQENIIFVKENVRVDNRNKVGIIVDDKPKQKAFTPKCPTCQSPNICKLTTSKRAVHGLAFGLFSKTARSQWECKNCGNKW